MTRDLLTILTTSMLFSSCYKAVDEGSNLFMANASAEPCQLTIRTLAADVVADAPRLLIFDATGSPCRDFTLANATADTTLTLDCGRYRLVALTGSEGFAWTGALEASAKLTYTDPLPTRPLMMGMADVTLASPRAIATLMLTTQTAQVILPPVSLGQETAAASVTLSPLHTAIDLNGARTSADIVTLPYHYDNGQWRSDAVHLLPSAGNSLVVSLEVVADDATRTYGYVVAEKLAAGGTYEIAPSADGGISLNGAEPLANNTDIFTVAHWPETPSLWDGHIVVQVTPDDDGNEGEMLLLSCNEWQGIHSAYYEADSLEAAGIAMTYQEGGSALGIIDDWHIPTRDEATALRKLLAAEASATINTLLANADYPTLSLTDASGNNVRYLCNDAQHTFTFASPTASLTKAGAKATYYLRLVKVVTVKLKEE